ncbi:PqqD family peptide modification chaperone [Georgenia sp. M64]|uniref:PqqD family peptide modification chaperone n=1 Tax=Georgenia sp. M64 TaxID=3120520 RepID=UPI0030E2E807
MYRLPRDVAAVVEADEVHPADVYLAKLPTGPLYALTGVSGLIWTEVAGQPEAGLVERVAVRAEQKPAAIEAQVKAFVSELVSLGLLERRETDTGR